MITFQTNILHRALMSAVSLAKGVARKIQKGE
jgi:hypothetical protein